MRSLLRLDFYRLKKSTLFYVLALMSFVLPAVLFAVSSFTNREPDGSFATPSIDGATGMLFLLVSLELCFFCALFVGGDQDQGTIKNKLIAGKSKTGILLSSFLVCAFAAVVFSALACLALLGAVFLLGLQPDWSVSIWYFPVLFGGELALTALFVTLSFAVSRKASAIIACVLALLILYMGVGLLLGKLNEPEQLPSFSMVNGESVAEMEPNPAYVSGIMRPILEHVISFFPTGQMYEIMTGFLVHPAFLLLYALLFTLLCLGAGLWIFNRRDLR